jgi:AcrR family transcriptional regulator
VIEAAFDLVSVQGIDALSMPRLAKGLGVSPMTVYSYVENKEELLAALTSRARVEVLSTTSASSASTWPDEVLERFRRARRLILRHPGLGGLLLRSGREVAEDPEGLLFELMESIIESIVRAGVAPPDAARLLESLSQYTTGFAVREAARREADARRGSQVRWKHSLQALDPARFPVLTSVVDVVLTSAGDEQFEFGLRAMINGVPRRCAGNETRKT